MSDSCRTFLVLWQLGLRARSLKTASRTSCPCARIRFLLSFLNHRIPICGSPSKMSNTQIF
jgi:hypothetical protein